MSRQVIVNIDPNSVPELNRNRYALCCFLACESPSYRAGSVLCWQVINDFLNTVEITVNHKFSAYFSTSPIRNQSDVFIPPPIDLTGFSAKRFCSVKTSNYRIKLQQQMIINQFNGVNIKSNTGMKNITISSQSTTPFSSGITVSDGMNHYGGICAFKLYKTAPLSIVPMKKIFLMMVADQSIKVNTVIEKTPQSGVLIDLNGAVNQTRTVSYNINTGWKALGSWFKHFPSQTDLAQLLIRPTSL